MKLSKAVANIIFVGALSACTYTPDVLWGTSEQNTVPMKATDIYLQEPFSRVVAHCYASAEYAAEACAKMFEQKGYVRFRNIPYKTARYDFLTKDTYPTRRWRENERTPRW
jgi:hypothetical protein